MEAIVSIKDERIVLARSLKTSRGRLEHQRILLEGEEILDYLLDIASGRQSKSEALGYGGAEFVPWLIGAVM